MSPGPLLSFVASQPSCWYSVSCHGTLLLLLLLSSLVSLSLPRFTSWWAVSHAAFSEETYCQLYLPQNHPWGSVEKLPLAKCLVNVHLGSNWCCCPLVTSAPGSKSFGGDRHEALESWPDVALSSPLGTHCRRDATFHAQSMKRQRRVGK